MNAVTETRATGPAREGETPSRLVLDAIEKAGLTVKPADWNERFASVAAAEVEEELSRPPRFDLKRLERLFSPAAAAYLEPMAVMARRLTRRRFGNAVGLFAPLYVSNYCVNRCRYCGFNAGLPHRRRRLSPEEALAEARIIAAEGFRDILLVSGEDRENVDVEYLARLAVALRGECGFSGVGIEVYTMREDQYRRLAEAGVDGVTIFQETYERGGYAHWHPQGPKSVMDHRIVASEAAARAGMRRIGLGVLLGLEDWRFDAMAMAVHADALARHYWRARTSFSFPRIRPAESGPCEFRHLLSDSELTQMILALRLCFPDSGMTLSTRESPRFRDNLIPLGITQISAGSKTNPGGYGDGGGAGSSTEQFAVSDERNAREMEAVLRRMGFDPVWKDWDAGFQG